MKWYEIIVNTNTEGTELIADVFFSIGCNDGVKIIDKNDIIDMKNNQRIWDNIDNDLLNCSEVAKVSGFVEEQDLNEKISDLRSLLEERKVFFGEITYKETENENWEEMWKRYYSPVLVGKFAIVPNWYNYENKDNKLVIYIEPGMAFGTGEHESTKLCLTLMSDIDFTGKKVIDVGCGSGVLGIGAILSKAKLCCMYDIDSIAVEASKENCLRNNIDMKLTNIQVADLLNRNTEVGDIVLANLTADIHIRLSKNLSKYIEKDGILICSGIINSRKNEVIEIFEKCGLKLIKQINMGEWNGLQFSK
ncbi:MAG: 50S ribosomal protein L11 methyltransferase [Clostridia bacterium]